MPFEIPPLKTCPWCKKRARIIGPSSRYNGYSVGCSTFITKYSMPCLGNVSQRSERFLYESPQIAAEMWNRREGED